MSTPYLQVNNNIILYYRGYYTINQKRKSNIINNIFFIFQIKNQNKKSILKNKKNKKILKIMIY